jgi:hypothetical protein
VLKTAIRWFSFVFHAVLILFFLAISLVAWFSRQPLRLAMLPWTGEDLTYWLLYGSLAGMVILVLAMRRTWPVLFLAWTLVVLEMVVHGYFIGPYSFAGREEFSRALYLTAGALLAVIGAWFQVRRPRSKGESALLRGHTR